MKTITLSDEDFKRVEEILKVAKKEKEETKAKKTIIYKIDGSILYESDKETIKEALVEAVDGEANLGGANLRGANLWEANLWGANLRGADL